MRVATGESHTGWGVVVVDVMNERIGEATLVEVTLGEDEICYGVG
ncbi:hypothetical protein [Dongshaea marina]|nr:hypothetical protein [Dongshaea marina]